MKKLLLIFPLAFSISAYAAEPDNKPDSKKSDWSLRPYVQMSAGLNSTSDKRRSYDIHHWQNWQDPDTHYYITYMTQSDKDKTSFGTTVEIGGEFKYKWFYSAIAINYNTSDGIIDDWSTINARIGGTYKSFSPYFKIGTLLHDNSELGKLKSGINGGFGLSVGITEHIYLEASYDTVSFETKNRLKEPYNSHIMLPGQTNVENSLKEWEGKPNIRWPDDHISEHEIINRTFRTGVKVVF